MADALGQWCKEALEGYRQTKAGVAASMINLPIRRPGKGSMGFVEDLGC